MRETLVCIGKIGTQGYYFDETGIRIYSYEELCYYFSRHMICYLYTLPEQDLLYYIRDELGLEKLFKQLIRLDNPEKDQMKYFSALYREGNYYSEDEIRDILDGYRRLKNAPEYLQNKWKGDLFIRYGYAKRALVCYQESLKYPKLSGDELGCLYHNLGIAHMKLFRFSEAKIDFVKAYQYVGDEKSLFYYYGIVALTKGMEEAAEELKTFDDSDILLDSFQEEFAKMKDDFAYTELAGQFQKLVYMRKNGREEEARRAKSRLVRRLQKDFRKELDI